ncbi:hypothetical protein [Sphingomonas turrisvirgatae]|uniref:Uncharacterized protein n=1 Tax=Sphingomonas turrisvirgatae TaxID=1888892 RepID=A0A1E3LR06_9SPHN|nr:hypothetical protein [Sphingomonas turrisvirgatae]ODP36199.1 hypothetical protein BFL28_07260 [Sphingomonas turrisvirgatae]
MAEQAGDWGPFAQQLAIWFAVEATCADNDAQAGVRAHSDELTAAAGFPATIGTRPAAQPDDAAEVALAEYRRWRLQGQPLLIGGIACALSAVRAEANAARWRRESKGTVGRDLIDLFDAGLTPRNGATPPHSTT